MPRPRARRTIKKGISRPILRWARNLSMFWVFSVVLLRFLTPPFTPLIAIRSVEYWLTGRPAIRGWEWRPLAYFPNHVQQSVVAAEDARFMEHWGIDLSAVGDAIDDSDARLKPRGASTITMQTVKNVFLWPGRSYFRKILEGVMAPIVDVLWGKRRTLELYLNLIEWGEGVYGLEAASQYYYGRPASKLSPREAAALAAILPAPRKLSPKGLSAGAEKRYQRILREAQGVSIPRR